MKSEGFLRWLSHTLKRKSLELGYPLGVLLAFKGSLSMYHQIWAWLRRSRRGVFVSEDKAAFKTEDNVNSINN